jgi:hypothetical protein
MTAHTPIRRAFSSTDLIWWLIALAILIAILLPSLARARELAKRAVCSANLRGIGQAMHIYSNDNEEWFPIHYYREPKDQPGSPPVHGIRWQGMMGSHDPLRISKATSPTLSPDAGHPSRSLFLLIIQGTSTSRQFICPSSRDEEDDLRNYGSDAGGNTTVMASQPGINRFDFRGYRHLSYGYQLPYGKKGRPWQNLDVRMAVMADKGPYTKEAGPGLEGTRTSVDGRSDVSPPDEWSGLGPAEVLRRPEKDWRPYNSRNHRGEGQNVLFVDDHVDFQKRPTVGVNNDNIYTIQSGESRISTLIGLMPAPDQLVGPMTNTDSFIVP